MRRKQSYGCDTHAPVIFNRIQRAGYCFLHAALTSASYVRALQQPPGSSVKHFSLADFLRRQWQVAYSIVMDKGGSSLQTLLSLGIERNAMHVVQDWRVLEEPEVIIEHLNTFGLGMLQDFTKKLPSYSDREACNERVIRNGQFATHALLMVGWRKDFSGTFYLMQNWWRDNEFFEISQRCLMMTGAEMIFVSPNADLTRLDS
eukprot:470913-Amphidinium_carterae.1